MTKLYRTTYQYEVYSTNPLPTELTVSELAEVVGAGGWFTRLLKSTASRLTDSQAKRAMKNIVHSSTRV